MCRLVLAGAGKTVVRDTRTCLCLGVCMHQDGIEAGEEESEGEQHSLCPHVSVCLSLSLSLSLSSLFLCFLSRATVSPARTTRHT